AGGVVARGRGGGAAAAASGGRLEGRARRGAAAGGARAPPPPRLAVVLGSPGLGKSRLLDEFTSRLHGATVLVATCEAAGGATFAPIARALRATLGLGAGGADPRAAIRAAVPGRRPGRRRIPRSPGPRPRRPTAT